MQHVTTSNIDYELVRAYKALLKHEAEQLRKKANYYLDENTVERIVSSATQNAKTIVDKLLDKGLLIRVGNKYTTMHAELIRKIINLSIRPGEIQVYEWRLLEPRETPLSNFTTHQYKDIEDIIAGYLARNNVDLSVARKAARALISGLKALGSGLSNYQYKMIKHALQHQWPMTLVLSAPTGSGKTLIFTVVALAYTLAKKLTHNSRSREPYVLLVYPRKALATDQLHRLIKLLYYMNKELEKAGLGDAKIDVGILDGDSLLTAMHAVGEGRRYVRGIRWTETSDGNLKCVYDAKDDTVECKVNNQPLGYRLVTDLRCDILRRPPAILITNVWMLEEHIIKTKSSTRLCNTQLGLDDVLFNARLLILDEAHVYKGFQQVAIASLVHRYVVELARRIAGIRLEELKTHNKNIIKLVVESLINPGDFAIILSSATITTVDEGCLSSKDPSIKAKFEEDIENFVKYMISPGVYRLIGGRKAIISENYDCVETNSKDTRLTILLILAPKPGVSASTLQQEVILATLAWSVAFKAKTGHPIKFISFFDNKDELSRVYRWITDIIIRERCEHCDHLAIPDYNSMFPPCGVNPTPRAKAAWKAYAASVISQRLNVNVNSLQQISGLHNITVKDIINAFYNNHEFWVTFPLSRNIRIAADLVKQITYVASEVCKGREIIGVHHGDMDVKTRQGVEYKFKKGGLLGLLSTQTLELGIDINDVGVVIQFKPPRKAENFVQRIGRAGRSSASFYTTLGILILSSIDTAYLIEDHAKEQLFHVRPEKPPYSNYNMVLATTLRYILYVLSKYNNKTQQLLAKAMARRNIAIGKFADLQKILTRQQSLRQVLADLHDVIEREEFRDTVIDLLMTMYQGSSVPRDMVLEAYNTIVADIDSILQGVEINVKDVYQTLDYLRKRVVRLTSECIEQMKSDIAGISRNIIKVYVKILERSIEEHQQVINNLLDELARKIEGLVESCNEARIGCEDINHIINSLKELLEADFKYPIQVVEYLDKCREIRVDEINEKYPSCRKVLSFIKSLCTY